MSTERLYLQDPYLVEFEAAVLERSAHDGRPAVVLDRTAFYAESGGQPCDSGTLDGVPVLAVLERGEAVLHVLGAPVTAARVHGRVDAERRRDHREQHHGQHLLSRAFVEVAGARTVSFHLGAERSTIDLDREVDERAAEAAERRANEAVWAALPVRVRVVTRADALARGVDAPAEAGDAVRLVEAEGFDLQPCGGTHPRSTAEVGVVLVLARERYKGGSRIAFVCGHRALTAFRVQGRTLAQLSAAFSSSIEALPEAARRALDERVASERRIRELCERALAGEARELLAAASGSPAVVVRAEDARPVEELRGLAQHLVALAPCVALLASRGEPCQVVFAQSPGLGLDVPALLRDALTPLGGRGGGRGDLAQGGAPSAANLDEALARAAATARERLLPR